MELRITAGAAIAVIYERAREIDEVSFVTLFSHDKFVKMLRLYELCCTGILIGNIHHKELQSNLL